MEKLTRNYVLVEDSLWIRAWITWELGNCLLFWVCCKIRKKIVKLNLILSPHFFLLQSSNFYYHNTI
jgi:hypothetical protein